ncbi:hypothetical protein [Pseudarthrobacter sp. AB1]|uniref:hypothetical protein n=1 Tax=Pseudarthrobacter sp. AB1 TaxID=2138309 RepID=UPI00186B5DA5|nr:hypothetical protein [Pseudarthrobacter sp. AB1]MBE4720500.1 hypothetical protein [Pseudarthrobacter sp. AB1]
MNVYEQVSDVRRNVRTALTVAVAVVVGVQVWYAIDPQLGPVTRAVSRAEDPFVSAWAVLLAAAVVGVFALARFVVGAALPVTRRGKVPALLGTAAVLALLAGVFTGMLAEGAAVAVLLAVVSSWVAVPKPDPAG